MYTLEKSKIFRTLAVIIIMIGLVAMALAVSGCETKVSEKEKGTKIEVPAVVTSGDEALKLLKDGNERFAKGELAIKDLGEKRREDLAGGQKPFAIILSCSDSRVPPELIFDQGLGDLFIIRVAGNVDDTINLGSIEYGAEHLHAPLLVVLGHSKCGAVKATVQGGDIPPNIAAIANKIKPSVELAKGRNKEEAAIVEDAVTENVKATIKDIEANSSIIREMSESGKLKIVGAKYDIETGKVEFLDEKMAE